MSNSYSSLVAARILIKLGAFLEGANVAGYLTGADGGYQVGDERYIPDVAFVVKARQPEPSHETYNPLAPDLAVEVISPSDDLNVLRVKVGNYLAAGTTVWVVRPEAKAVEVYAPGQPVRRVSADGALDGGDVLPGLSLPVKDLFPD
ncbi:MAG: Uma2 family endonuclease [Anaerolineae bacterium]|nr:Uma2 family endonuclease [Anaerolineae bacterium]